MSFVTMPNTFNCLYNLDGDSLVTDIAHELSASLENPSELTESLSFFDNDIEIKSEDEEENVLSEFLIDDDLLKYKPLYQREIDEQYPGIIKTDFSSGNSSDGSDLQWTVKPDLDTPPITPPREGTPPDNLLVFSTNELSSLPLHRTKTKVTPKPQPQPIKPKVMSNVPFANNDNSLLMVKRKIDLKRITLPAEEIQKQQARRKQERMIRNRESAYLSRKRKKEHMQELEKKVDCLTNENNRLRVENSNLKERLSKYEGNLHMYTSNQSKSKASFNGTHKKTTALIALLVTVCLNISSFSNVMEIRNISHSVQTPLEDNYHGVHRSRSLLWTSIDETPNGLYTNSTICPLSINITESIRLESELRRWIEGEKTSFDSNKKVLQSRIPYKRKRVPSKPKREKLNNKELDVFVKHRINFDSLYEAIHRRDDTFYLVSFSPNHLLLPALARNQSSRPKMSLMLPAFIANSSNSMPSDKVEMMQIDCEVTNTQLLSVNEGDIPIYLRSKFVNDSVKAPDSVPLEMAKIPQTGNSTKSPENYEFLKHLANGYKNLSSSTKIWFHPDNV